MRIWNLKYLYNFVIAGKRREGYCQSDLECPTHLACDIAAEQCYGKLHELNAFILM